MKLADPPVCFFNATFTVDFIFTVVKQQALKQYKCNAQTTFRSL